MRYRNIHCVIWNDDKFPFASDDCQLVIFHLLTTPLSSSFGLYKASLPALADEKRWSMEKYMKAFREALDIGFVRYDEKHRVVLIPNFLQYNPPQSPNVIRSWRIPFMEVPNSTLKDEFLKALTTLLIDYDEGFNLALQEAFSKGFLKTPSPDTAPDVVKKKGGLGGSRRFVPPTLDDVKAYCQERKNTIKPQTFIDHYQAKGWKIGKNKMKDWKAAVRTWENRDKEDGGRKFI